jgi:hypothetical protein
VLARRAAQEIVEPAGHGPSTNDGGLVVDLQRLRRAFASFLDIAPNLEQRTAHLPYAALMTSSRTPHQAQAAGLVARGGCSTISLAMPHRRSPS